MVDLHGKQTCLCHTMQIHCRLYSVEQICIHRVNVLEIVFGRYTLTKRASQLKRVNVNGTHIYKYCERCRLFYVIHVILSCLKHLQSLRKRTCPSTSPSLLTVLSSVSIFGAMKFASSLRLGAEEQREAASVLLEAQGEAKRVIGGGWIQQMASRKSDGYFRYVQKQVTSIVTMEHVPEKVTI